MARPYLRTMKPMPPPVVKPTHTHRVGVAGGERQTVRVGRSGEVAGRGARLDAGDPRLGVDTGRALIGREVDDDVRRQ